MVADTEIRDEFEEYLAEALRDPSFARAYKRAAHWSDSHPRPLCINGHEYARRQRARRRRGR
jgi:hypothetical protein